MVTPVNVSGVEVAETYMMTQSIQVASVVISVFGIVGNTLAFLVARRLPEVTSGIAFMQCLAVADTLAILKDGGLQQLLPLLGVDLRLINKYCCKLIIWLSYVVTIADTNIIMFFSVDRLVALYRPVAYKLHGKPAAAVKCSVLVLLYQCVACSPNLLFGEIHKGHCELLRYDRERGVLHLVYTVFTNVNFAVLPILVVLVCNTLIVVRMRERSCKVGGGGGGGQTASSSSAVTPNGGRSGMVSKRQELANDVTRQLLATSFVFVILVTFSSLQMTYVTIKSAEERPGPLYDLAYVGKNFTQNVNQSINFLVYALAGRMFRQKFFEMVRFATLT